MNKIRKEIFIMEISRAAEVLNGQGIKAEIKKISKNGREMDAIVLGEGAVRPTAYQDSFDSIRNDEELVAFAKELLRDMPDFDLQGIMTKDYVLSHVRSCVRHKTCDSNDVRFTVFGDLEEYFRIILDADPSGSIGSIVVRDEHIESLGISPWELRSAGRANLARSAEIAPMAGILAELMGENAPAQATDEDELMYIATVEDRTYGAGVMLLDGVMDGFCREHGIRSAYILPSSVHEVIIINGDADREAINAIIRDVNKSCVAEDEQLSDHSYRFSVAA